MTVQCSDLPGGKFTKAALLCRIATGRQEEMRTPPLGAAIPIIQPAGTDALTTRQRPLGVERAHHLERGKAAEEQSL